MLFGDLHDRRHIGHATVEVDGDDGPGPLADRRLDLLHVEVEVGVHINQNRSCPNVYHRRRGGDKRVGGHDDLVTRPDSRGSQRHVQRVVATIEPHREPGSDSPGKVFFEAPELLPVDQVAAFHDFEIGGIELGLELLVELARVDKPHLVGQCGLLPGHEPRKV